MSTQSKKPCVISLDAVNEPHLKQILILMPKACDKDTAGSDDDEPNLETGKNIWAYIKVNQLEVGTDAKPLSEHMVTEKPKRK